MEFLLILISVGLFVGICSVLGYVIGFIYVIIVELIRSLFLQLMKIFSFSR